MIKSEQIVHAVHLMEKFRKAIIAMLVVIIATILVYSQSEYIINMLTVPLNGTGFYSYSFCDYVQ